MKESMNHLMKMPMKTFMKKSLKHLVISGLLCAGCTLPVTTSHATEMVFEFTNPAFGGSPLNGSWLLSSAQTQNKLKESRPIIERDPIKDFQESLNRQILYRLSRQIIDDAFGGNEGMSDGHYNVGDFLIDIETGLEGLRVIISNQDGSSETVIEVPYY